jgi:hypothetical protein
MQPRAEDVDLGAGHAPNEGRLPRSDTRHEPRVPGHRCRESGRVDEEPGRGAAHPVPRRERICHGKDRRRHAKLVPRPFSRVSGPGAPRFRAGKLIPHRGNLGRGPGKNLRGCGIRFRGRASFIGRRCKRRRCRLLLFRGHGKVGRKHRKSGGGPGKDVPTPWDGRPRSREAWWRSWEVCPRSGELDPRSGEARTRSFDRGVRNIEVAPTTVRSTAKA